MATVSRQHEARERHVSAAPEPVKSPIWEPARSMVWFIVALLMAGSLLAGGGAGLMDRLYLNGGCV